MALLKIVSNGPLGEISRCLSQTVKHTAYTENMYIAYLLSLVACQLNGLDYQCEAEVLHRRALCIGIRCIGKLSWVKCDGARECVFVQAGIIHS